MHEYIKIAFVTDDNYFENTLVAIESILESTTQKNRLVFYILDLGISEKNIKFLKNKYIKKNNIIIKLENVGNSKIINYKIKTHVSIAAYAKIYLPNIIKEDKVIYLDSDLIVSDDIFNLWNEFENNISVKAVCNPFYNYDNKYLGITDNSKTFNSGVMLLNLDLMRMKNSSNELEKFLDMYHDKTKLHDQAAFNAVFKDSWKELDLRWNCQVIMLQNHYTKLNISQNLYFSLYKEAKIIHFTSNSKPWQFRNNHPYKSLYLKFYNQVYGSIKYNDIHLKSLLQRIKETVKYRYYYYLNFK